MMIGKHWKINQAIAGCIITLGGFGFGCGLSWTATALPNLDETGRVGSLTSMQKSWMASFFALGAILACPVTGLYVHNFKRKKCLLGFTSISLLGWLLLGCAADPIYIYFGRLLTGASTAGYTIVVPIYISEIASKESRGTIGSLFILMLYLGKLFSNGMGLSFPASTASFLCALHPIIYASCLLVIPESPKLLIRIGELTDAYHSLKWLKTTGLSAPFPCIPKRACDSQEIWTDLESMKSTVHKSHKDDDNTTANVSFQEYFASPELHVPCTIIFIQMLFAQFCGINVSTFFTLEIFRFSGNNIVDPNHATLILAVIQTLGCLPCSIFVDKYGRRPLVISSFSVMSMSMLGIAIFFYTKSARLCILESYPIFGLVPIICLIIYNMAYGWGIGSVVWIIMSELLPPRIAGTVSAISNIIYWGGAFCVTEAFHLVNTEMYSWFMLFSLICVLGCFFNIYFLPETKGLSSQEIQTIFKKETPN